jgi:hypothetical protein
LWIISQIFTLSEGQIPKRQFLSKIICRATLLIASGNLSSKDWTGNTTYGTEQKLDEVILDKSRLGSGSGKGQNEVQKSVAEK